MKKVFILLITFCMLFSLNANAGIFSGANADNFTPKNEISDNKNSRKIKTIQKLLSTKIGKWVVTKTIKKLQRQALNPQKNKNKVNLSTGGILLVVFGVILVGGIVLIFSGSVVLGVILAVFGLLLLALSYFTVAFFNPDNWRRVKS